MSWDPAGDGEGITQGWDIPSSEGGHCPGCVQGSGQARTSWDTLPCLDWEQWGHPAQFGMGPVGTQCPVWTGTSWDTLPSLDWASWDTLPSLGWARAPRAAGQRGDPAPQGSFPRVALRELFPSAPVLSCPSPRRRLQEFAALAGTLQAGHLQARVSPELSAIPVAHWALTHGC